MELKYFAYIPAGAVICLIAVLLFILYKHKAKGFQDGIKVANMDLLLYDKYIKGRIIAYKVLRIVLLLSVIAAIMSSFVILARPYYTRKIKESQYNRDIMLCLDVSSSVDELNKKLVKDMQKLVKELHGERIGIVMFNTTPVLLVPLTDDYEYVIEQLENIRTAIKVMSDNNGFYSNSDWLYWNNFLYSGTLVGNVDRGSSLIGDGLLGALFNFPEEETDRTRIIVLSTDNDCLGDSYVTLTEAAKYCKDNDVYVYGIGTTEMYEDNLEEMKAAVESTNGKFYLEENSYTFHNIVEEIQSLSAGLVKGRTIITEVESPENAFLVLCISFIILIAVSIVLKRVNAVFLILQPLIFVLLIVSYFFVIAPAKYAVGGYSPDINKQSDLNVLFVVDDTLSMLANDMYGPRLSKMKSDCANIVDELDGANFSVISFNNDSQVLMPYNNNSEHVKNIINSIYPIEEFYAKGSSMNTPKEIMKTCLEKVKYDSGNKTAVFFISDGEITSDSSLESYSELSKYIDYGAVLGYGTEDGGTMEVRTYMGDTQTVVDYSVFPFEDAVSRIDEDNLKKLAADMDISYIHMTNGIGLDSILSDIKSNINITVTEKKKDNNDSETVTIDIPENDGYMIYILIAVLMFGNAVYIAVKK